jgi:hypothetical protein
MVRRLFRFFVIFSLHVAFSADLGHLNVDVAHNARLFAPEKH